MEIITYHNENWSEFNIDGYRYKKVKSNYYEIYHGCTFLTHRTSQRSAKKLIKLLSDAFNSGYEQAKDAWGDDY